MRTWVVLLAGCFAPSAPANVPCDPAMPACPTGQRCVLTATGHACSTGDGITLGDDAAIVVDAASDAPPDSIVPPIQRTYLASVAECTSPVTPDPELCRTRNGDTELVIDIRDSTTTDPWHSFLRFDLDGALQGRTITKVVLRLVVTTATNAPGPDGGTVFEVQPFTLASLSTTIPAKVGTMLATHATAIDTGDVIDFTLATPAALAEPNMAVYLGLFPNDDNGVNYYNLDGPLAGRPRLIVDAN